MDPPGRWPCGHHLEVFGKGSQLRTLLDPLLFRLKINKLSFRDEEGSTVKAQAKCQDNTTDFLVCNATHGIRLGQDDDALRPV